MWELSDALMAEAGKSGWNVISMKNDGSAFLHSTSKSIPCPEAGRISERARVNESLRGDMDCP
jgi:hypothetical protein